MGKKISFLARTIYIIGGAESYDRVEVLPVDAYGKKFTNQHSFSSRNTIIFRKIIKEFEHDKLIKITFQEVPKK